VADPSARRPSRGASRILVTDTQERAGLAVARCLHDAGFSVTAAADTPAAPGLWSRLVARRRLVPSPGTDADGFVTAIQRILEAEQHALVLPVTDDALLAISRRREQLAPLVGMGLPSHGAVERALDRERMSGAAARAGLAPPEGETCAGPEEAVTAAADGYRHRM
jgi:predicted ATP-grasp superfamily ATP-dependent carboligase